MTGERPLRAECMLREAVRFSVTLNRPDAEILTVVPEPTPGPATDQPTPIPGLVFYRGSAGPEWVLFHELLPGLVAPASAVADRVHYPVRFGDPEDRLAWALAERARPKPPLPPVERAIWLVRDFARDGVSLWYQPRAEPGAGEAAPASVRVPLHGFNLIPPTWLPAGTQEGDVLAATLERAPDGWSVTLRVAPDHAARALLKPETWEFLRRVDEATPAWRREREEAERAGAERPAGGAPRRLWIFHEQDVGMVDLIEEERVEGFPDVRRRARHGGLPLAWLPEGAAENDVLAVTDEREPGGAVVLRVTLDPATVDDRLRRWQQQLERHLDKMRREEARRRGGDAPPR